MNTVVAFKNNTVEETWKAQQTDSNHPLFTVQKDGQEVSLTLEEAEHTINELKAKMNIFKMEEKKQHSIRNASNALETLQKAVSSHNMKSKVPFAKDSQNYDAVEVAKAFFVKQGIANVLEDMDFDLGDSFSDEAVILILPSVGLRIGVAQEDATNRFLSDPTYCWDYFFTFCEKMELQGVTP